MHVAAPDKSVFHVMSNDAFVSLTGKEIQLLFSKKHIVIHQLPTIAVQFDEDGMKTLVPPWKTFTIQGIFSCCIRMAFVDLRHRYVGRRQSPAAQRPYTTGYYS